MFYLGRSQPPVPAEGPYLAHVNEKKQWDYNQKKHKEAIDQIVDRKPQGPHNQRRRGEERPAELTQEEIDDRIKRCQAGSRRFAIDSKRAEIGRENRKLVEKLTSIAKSSGQCAPPGQLVGYGAGQQPASLGGGCTSKAPPRPPMPVAPGASERSRSLNDNYRRKEQKRVDQDNASMVRRILSVKSTFNPVADERHFQHHKRTVTLLQRLPGDGGRKPRSLPPIRPPRPNSYPEPARGLETLMLPSDLHRCQSGPGAFGREARFDGAAQPGPTHATTAPAGSLPDPNSGTATLSEGAQLGTQQSYSFGGFDTYDSLSLEGSQSRSVSEAQGGREAGSAGSAGGVSQNTLPRPGVGPGPEEEAGSAARGASAFGKRDEETERRQWTQEGGDDGKAGGVGITAQGGAGAEATPTPGGRMGMTGMSSVSELQYAEDWDEYSFNSSGNADASGSKPSRGPSSQSVRTHTENNPPAATIPEEASQSSISASPPGADSSTVDFSSPPDFSKKPGRRPR